VKADKELDIRDCCPGTLMRSENGSKLEFVEWNKQSREGLVRILETTVNAVRNIGVTYRVDRSGTHCHGLSGWKVVDVEHYDECPY
jgi:hypothetical protein